MIYCYTSCKEFETEIAYVSQLLFQVILKTEYCHLKQLANLPSDAAMIIIYGDTAKEYDEITLPIIHVIASDFFSVGLFRKPSSLPQHPLARASVDDLKLTNDVLCGEDLPVLYGEMIEDGWVANRKNRTITSIDIFAATFFMVTRYEEILKTERDQRNRFPATASLAYQEGFLERPIVNEMALVLWDWIKQLQPSMKRERKDFRAMLTHDVDHPRRWAWKSWGQIIRSVGGSVLRRRDIRTALKRLKYKMDWCPDPYDTFDWLMNLSEFYGLQSRFYFMAASVTPHDSGYDIHRPAIKQLFRTIKRRGHVVGFHPSYYTYNDQALWQTEKERLDLVVGETVVEGRQHVLRFETPSTWRIWENAGMKIDSTLGYPDQVGFRAGLAEQFPVYDVLERRQLDLQEAPLVVMDASLHDYQSVSPDDAWIQIQRLVDRVRQMDGLFVLLWHNSALSAERNWQSWAEVYTRTLASLAQAGAVRA